MPVKERLPVWHEVLRVYKACRGSGLSAHALIHLTGIPWVELRKQIVERHEKHKDMYVYRCGVIQAELITTYPAGGNIVNLPLIDEMVKKYDPEKWQGISQGKPQKELNVYGGPPTMDALLKVVAEYDQTTATKQPK